MWHVHAKSAQQLSSLPAHLGETASLIFAERQHPVDQRLASPFVSSCREQKRMLQSSSCLAVRKLPIGNEEG
jgi:hypothetical protein